MSSVRSTVRPRKGLRSPSRYALRMLVFALVVLGMGLSVGPYRDWRDASARLSAVEQEVALLEQGNQALESQAARLEKDSYLEALARKDLNLARPGEEVFIVKGLPDTDAPAAAVPSPEAGPLERMVGALRRLF